MEGRSNQPNAPVRVLLADDHTMFREGLASLLSSYGGMEVVGEAPNNSEAIELAAELRPDVVVMEVQIPLHRAEGSVLELLKVSPPPKVIITTMFEEPFYMRELLELGASAYILKSSSAQQLVGTIRGAIFDPKGKHAVVGLPRELLEKGEEDSEGILSARELEILLLASRGLSNTQISTTLAISEATVKRHLANVYRKMGVGSRTEAVRQALSQEWITIREITSEEDKQT